MEPSKNNKIHYLAIDSKDNKTIVAEGNSIEEVMNKIDKSGKDCIIAPKLEENVTYIF